VESGAGLTRLKKCGKVPGRSRKIFGMMKKYGQGIAIYALFDDRLGEAGRRFAGVLPDEPGVLS
jgi:hypothetical protein